MNIKNKLETSVKKQFDLSGKNVIITGGGGFLGYYFANAVAEMGAKVCLLDSSAEGLSDNINRLKKDGFKASNYQLDIVDVGQVVKVIREANKSLGSLDVLINAGAFAMRNLKKGAGNFFANFEDYDYALWQICIDVNLTGTFLVTQAVGRIMKKQQQGVVINIASDVGVISPDHRIYQPNRRYDYEGVKFNTPLSYSVSKAGIISMTRYLATYWANDGIRVNALSPAGVYRDQNAKFVEQLAERIPLGRMAFPQELKGPIVFLASDASSFMTGGNLIIDGGRTIW